MGHPDAMQSVLSGQTVNSHFTVAPFNTYELRVPGIHQVLSSYETDCKHTNGIQVTTKAFHDANPKICHAVRAAHEEANAFIKREPKAAVEIYLKLTNDKKNSADDLVAMISDPDIDYTTAPAGVMERPVLRRGARPQRHLTENAASDSITLQRSNNLKKIRCFVMAGLVPAILGCPGQTPA